MSYGKAVSHEDHDHRPGFIKRWFFSTNHKDIGTLYIIFAILAGLVGGYFSLIMRAELAAPGLDVVADGQAWNVIITCLLYTSPSPRDLSTSRMPSSA